MTRPKLFAFQPLSHGQLSFYVCAGHEDEAFSLVDVTIKRRLALDYYDEKRLSPYEVEGWGTPYYTVTVCEYGEVIDNPND